MAASALTVTTWVATQPVLGIVYTIAGLPPIKPETTPVEPTDACNELLLLQLPPGVPSVRLIVEPTHTEADPPIDAGDVLTVTTAEFVQPVDVCVKVILVVPGVKPLTTPVDAPIVAVPGVPLTQVPAPDDSVKVLVAPVHESNVPPNAAGVGFTVATTELLHPVEVNVNVMVEFPPNADTPLTTPPLVTVATPVVPLLQVPAPDPSVKVTVPPGQIAELPVGVAGGAT